MPVRTLAGGRKATVWFLLLASAMLLALGADALAQFGAPRPVAPPAGADGIAGWLLGKQAEFYRMLSGTIRSAKTDGSAVWLLLGISFAYGVFHAAGPGHGKAVISSYLVANEETWKRGITLSFLSSMLQALVAVAVVGVAAFVFQAGRKAICDSEYYFEIASYALIAAMGARLLWVKGKGFLREWALLHMPKSVGAAATHAPARHDHGHHHHTHDDKHHHDDHDHDHDHDHDQHGHDHHDHDHDDHSGHSHGPTPDQLAGPGGWKRGLTAIVAVGLRPCSGAILVLVFALAQGIFWTGTLATFAMGFGTFITVAAIATITVTATSFATRLAAARTGYGSLALRGVEVGAATLVLFFGIVLLAGYMVNERLVMVCQ